MVDLRPYLHAHRYQSRLRILEQVFTENEDRYERRIVEARRQLIEHTDRARATNEDTTVRDAQGNRLHDKADEYYLVIDDIGLMRMEGRKGIAIQLYHLWERSVQSWIKGPEKPDHKKLVRMNNLVVSSPAIARIEELRRVVNTLKHDSTDRLKELEQVRDDLVDYYYDAQIGTPRPYERVALPFDSVMEFFELARQSGPELTASPWPDILPSPVVPYGSWIVSSE